VTRFQLLRSTCYGPVTTPQMIIEFYVDCSLAVSRVPSGGSLIILEECLPDARRCTCHAHSTTLVTVPELNCSYLVSKEKVVKIPVSAIFRLRRYVLSACLELAVLGRMRSTLGRVH
jgi:hypothetical protein